MHGATSPKFELHDGREGFEQGLSAPQCVSSWENRSHPYMGVKLLTVAAQVSEVCLVAILSQVLCTDRFCDGHSPLTAVIRTVKTKGYAAT